MTATQTAVVIDAMTASADERLAVVALAREAHEVDGASPLDDQVRLDLEYSSDDDVRHVFAHWPGSLDIIGYAHLDLGSPTVATAHIVVGPCHRRRGVASALVARLAELAGPRVLRYWSHGDLGAAASLAESLGFRRVRDLWQMTLLVDTRIDRPHYPDGVTVRTFTPGLDEDAWVATNAAAFSDHPEQGGVTVEDLRQRQQQPWFDASGFFLAERGGELLGSHWTKVHVTHDGVPEVGEVYVVGVHPDAQGLGLGKALTLTGLHFLREKGLRDKGLDVILYVDADNAPAVAIYRRIGFTTTNVDVMYERP